MCVSRRSVIAPLAQAKLRISIRSSAGRRLIDMFRGQATSVCDEQSEENTGRERHNRFTVTLRPVIGPHCRYPRSAAARPKPSPGRSWPSAYTLPLCTAHSVSGTRASCLVCYLRRHDRMSWQCGGSDRQADGITAAVAIQKLAMIHGVSTCPPSWSLLCFLYVLTSLS